MGVEGWPKNSKESCDFHGLRGIRPKVAVPAGSIRPNVAPIPQADMGGAGGSGRTARAALLQWFKSDPTTPFTPIQHMLKK